MTSRQNIWLRLGLIALIVVGLSFTLTRPSQAQGVVIYGDQVPAGTTVDNDVILFGKDVVVAGDVKGDVFALGQTVTISGTIDGSLATIGESVSIKGPVNGTTYNASVRTELSPAAKLAKNLYYAGVSLFARPGSSIGRDLYVISVGAELTGNVDRNVVGVIGPVQIINLIYRAFTGGASLPVIGATSPGSYAWQVQGAAALAPVSMINLVDTGLGIRRMEAAAQAGSVDWNQVGTWFVTRLRGFITLLILGAILAWLFPFNMKRWAVRSTEKPWLVALYGLAYIILAFVGAIIAAVVVVGLALAFAFIKLGGLGFLIAALGLFTIGILFFVFYLFAFFISKVVFAYLLGMLIFKRLAPNLAEGRFWPFLLGLVIYIFLVAIPYVGWIVAFAAVLLGTGSIGLAYIKDRNLVEQALITKDASIDATREEPAPAQTQVVASDQPAPDGEQPVPGGDEPVSN